MWSPRSKSGIVLRIALKSREAFCRHVAFTCLCLLVAMILFGFTTFHAIYFPSFADLASDGKSVPDYLLGFNHLCLATEGRNQNRILGWRMARAGDADVICAADTPLLVFLGVDENGRPTSSDSPALQHINSGATLLKSFRDNALYLIERPKGKGPRTLTGDKDKDALTFSLSGDALLAASDRAVNTAFSYFPSGLRPFFKKRPGTCSYKAAIPPFFKAKRLETSMTATVLGPESVVKLRVRAANDDRAAVMSLYEDKVEAGSEGGRVQGETKCFKKDYQKFIVKNRKNES